MGDVRGVCVCGGGGGECACVCARARAAGGLRRTRRMREGRPPAVRRNHFCDAGVAGLDADDVLDVVDRVLPLGVGGAEDGRLLRRLGDLLAARPDHRLQRRRRGVLGHGCGVAVIGCRAGQGPRPSSRKTREALCGCSRAVGRWVANHAGAGDLEDWRNEAGQGRAGSPPGPAFLCDGARGRRNFHNPSACTRPNAGPQRRCGGSPSVRGGSGRQSAKHLRSMARSAHAASAPFRKA